MSIVFQFQPTPGQSSGVPPEAELTQTWVVQHPGCINVDRRLVVPSTLRVVGTPATRICIRKDHFTIIYGILSRGSNINHNTLNIL